MSSQARVRVTFVMEYEAGSYGDDATIGQIRKQAVGEARNCAERVVRIAMTRSEINLVPIRLHIEKIDDTVTVALPPENGR